MNYKRAKAIVKGSRPRSVNKTRKAAAYIKAFDAPTTYTGADLASMTVLALKALAKSKGLTGYSKSRKAGLVNILTGSAR